jgi:hypothetical protein
MRLEKVCKGQRISVICMAKDPRLELLIFTRELVELYGSNHVDVSAVSKLVTTI